MLLSVIYVVATAVLAHAGKIAVVRVISTSEEIDLLSAALTEWESLMPCSDTNKTSSFDMVLVYSKDFAMDSKAMAAAEEYQGSFASRSQQWTACFAELKNFSAKLSPEEDQYDDQGYALNKHWVSGPNMVFKSVMEAMYTGTFADQYDSVFWMEMDAVPIRPGWLDVLETEAMEMPAMNMAIRGSMYRGSNWDTFAHMMPSYLLKHINGNAIYNLQHPWTKFLFDTTVATVNADLMDEMAFDTAYAAITMAAMAGTDDVLADAWAKTNGTSTTYSSDTQLIANYANTLLNMSYDSGVYIRHGSKKNLLDNFEGDMLTLGVQVLDEEDTDRFLRTIPTNHPFKTILMLGDYQSSSTQTIQAPQGNVTLSMEPADSPSFMHICEVAGKVTTPWFAVTSTNHIINAPVSVLGSAGMPVMPYVLSSSTYCSDRPDCLASLSQAEELFGTTLRYHHDTTEFLFNTSETQSFCDAWTLAAGDRSIENCQLAFGPTADDFVAWKISMGMNINGLPRDKSRSGFRSWTSLWQPTPVSDRNCSQVIYGEKEFNASAAHISQCALNVENSSACLEDVFCMWKPMFESGICVKETDGLARVLSFKVPTTTTTAGLVYSTIEVTLPL